MTIAARPAGSPDIPALVELMREFYSEAGYPLDEAWATQAFRTILANPGFGSAWILTEGTAAAGYVVLSVRFSMEYGGLEGVIDDLFVQIRYRRLGLAREGLRVVLEECRRRNVAAVSVVVGEGNAAAIALYASCGLQRPADDRIMLRATLGP